MKKALISTIHAWGISVAFICIACLINFLSEAGDKWYSLDFAVFAIWALYAGVVVAVVVFPTCLLVVAPLLKLLPRSSPLWNRPIAAAIGAVAGPVAMYLWAAGFSRQMFIPEWHEGLEVFLAAASALAGATFAFSYASPK